MNDAEQNLLRSNDDPRENLRLACAVPVEAWMDGIEFEMVPDGEVGSSEMFEEQG